MAASVMSQATYVIPRSMYNPTIRKRLAIYRHFLRTEESTTLHAVDINKMRMHIGDLYGYLKTMGIVDELHWVVLLISDLNDPSEFGLSTKLLYIPDIRIVETILTLDN